MAAAISPMVSVPAARRDHLEQVQRAVHGLHPVGATHALVRVGHVDQDRPVTVDTTRVSCLVSMMRTDVSTMRKLSNGDRRRRSDMDQRVRTGGLDVAASLHRFVEEEALPGTGLDPATFWEGAGAIVHDLAPRNRELLARREELQAQLDDWHREHPGIPDPEAYAAFLREIGYLLDEPADVSVSTDDVDDEVARIAGPQLVVPLLNARFATNAVNARWGSLYDALYGTDVIAAPTATSRPATTTTRSAATRSSPAAAPSSTSTSRSPAAPTPTPRRTPWTPTAWPSPSRTTPCGWPTRPSWSGTAATPRQPGGGAARPPRAARRDPGRPPTTRSARPTRPGSRTCCSSPRSPRSWTSRTPSRPSTPTTRCSATATGCG